MKTTVKNYEDLFNNVNIYYRGTRLNYFDEKINMVITEQDEDDSLPNGIYITGNKENIYSFNIINKDDSIPFNIIEMLLMIVRAIDDEDCSKLSLEKQFDEVMTRFTFEVKTTEACTSININRLYEHIDCFITLVTEYRNTRLYSFSKKVNKSISIQFKFNADNNSWIKDLIWIAEISKEVIFKMRSENDI